MFLVKNIKTCLEDLAKNTMSSDDIFNYIINKKAIIGSSLSVLAAGCTGLILNDNFRNKGDIILYGITGFGIIYGLKMINDSYTALRIYTNLDYESRNKTVRYILLNRLKEGWYV